MMLAASTSTRGMPLAPAITSATIPNEIASAQSAASTPAPATTSPPKSGPSAAQTVKPKFITAFPSRSIPGDVRIAPDRGAGQRPRRGGEGSVERGEDQHGGAARTPVRAAPAP